MLLIKSQLILLVQKFTVIPWCMKNLYIHSYREIFPLFGILVGMYLGHFTYKQLRPPKSNSSSYYQQLCLSFLMTGKCFGENLSLPEHKHIEILDGGGL